MILNTALGYGLITAAVLLAVIIYTIIRLRKQARNAKTKEKQKQKENL